MNVRLTDKQIQGIIAAIKQVVQERPMQLYLYGSRTQLAAKGGDIDLLLLFDSMNDKKTGLSTKHILMANIKHAIGDQKIDIIFASKAELKHDAFLKIIFPGAILLYENLP